MISDDELAVLCDIARASGADLSSEKAAIVSELIDRKLVSETAAIAGKPRYRILPDGQAILDDRGVGATES